MKMLDLMVTADDFGVNNARDTGIMELLHQGVLTHVSLLVNGETTKEAARTFMDDFPSSIFPQHKTPTPPCEHEVEGVTTSSTQTSLISSTSTCGGEVPTSSGVGVPSFRRVQFMKNVDYVAGSSGGGSGVRVVSIAPRCGPPSIGLHFNITEGPPLSDEMRKCDTLVYFDDELNSFRFRGKAHNLVALDGLKWSDCDSQLSPPSKNDDDILLAIQCELNAQLATFFELTTKQPPRVSSSDSTYEENCSRCCWVDGHHHVHVTGVVHTLLQSHPQISGTRSPRDFSLMSQGKTSSDLGTKLFMQESDCFGPPFWAHLASKSIHNNNNKSTTVCRGLNDDDEGRGGRKITTDYFIGLDIMGSACSVEALHARLCSIMAAASTTTLNTSTTTIPTVEVMTHVGFPVSPTTVVVDSDNKGVADPFYHDEFSRSEERRHEYMVYSSSTCC